jgi:hypothetical protein
MDSRLVHELVPEQEEVVDDPLIVEQVRVGLAKSPQLDGRVFIGVVLEGTQRVVDGREDAHGEVVLTVELAEALAELLVKAVAKARGQGEPGHA